MKDQELQDLIRLKRYEQPEEGYFESFLEEFHEKRQQELLTNSARSLLMERIGVWFNQLGAIKWVAGAGLAYAAVAISISVWNVSDESALPVAHTDSAEQASSAESSPEVQIIPLSLAHSEPVSFHKVQQPVVGGTDQLF